MDLYSLMELLKKANSVEEIDAHREEIAKLIPRVRSMFDYNQKNYTHQYDLWMHSLYVVLGIPRNMEDGFLYLAALLHDIGKPECQVRGKRPEDTNMHYYGHPEKGMEIVRDEIIPELISQGNEITDNEKRRLLYYIKWHDDGIRVKRRTVNRHLNMGASLKEFKQLIMLQEADARAHNMIPVLIEKIEICQQMLGGKADELYESINGK